MTELITRLFLILGILLGTAGMGWSVSFGHGLDAHEKHHVFSLGKWKTLARGDYQKGLGAYRKEDYATALRELRPLAERGYALAQTHMGLMYRKGGGVPQDYKIALQWFRLSAEQGHALAQTMLGLMYANGEGLVQNNVFAHMWGNIAASNGNEPGEWVRDTAAKKMTPSQIEEALRLARECVTKNYKDC